MVIISVIFNKKKYSTKKAREYLKKHNLLAKKKVHVTDRYYRYRINTPIKGRKYATWSLATPGVKYIILL